MTLDGKLELLDVGAGRPVLLLHGSPVPATHLAPLVRALKATRRVLVPDLPGYGSSPALGDDHTLAEATRLLESALSQLDVHDCDVVGHSLGAYRAFALALNTRIRVGSLVSLSGFAGLDPEHARGYAELAAALRGGFDAAPVLVDRALATDHARQHPEHVARCFDYVSSVPTSVFASEMQALARAEDLRPRLGALGCAVTLRSGASDASVPTAWSEALVRLLPRATLQIVPNSGHMLLLEDEDATVRSVLQALSASSSA